MRKAIFKYLYPLDVGYTSLFLFNSIPVLDNKKTALDLAQFYDERDTGIEPASPAWEADILPLY